MKKLELKQLEKMYGGYSSRRCDRIIRRFLRNDARGNYERAWKLVGKYNANC